MSERLKFGNCESSKWGPNLEWCVIHEQDPLLCASEDRDRYKDFLKKHGAHADGCAYVPSDGIYPSYGECDCGWKELSKELGLS